MIRFPGEWEPHAATWMAWPHDSLTFPRLESVERTFSQAIQLLAKAETVNVLAPERLHHRIPSNVKNHEHVVVHDVPTADVWLRDTGPLFVRESFLSVEKKGKPVATCWDFNAWGSKYHGHLADRGLNQTIAKLAGVKSRSIDMVLEGGSIDSNGAGLCLTSDQCLLNKNRNPSLSKKQIEDKLKTHLGFTHFLWLKNGIAGDDTDGHIDDLARFVNEKTVVHAVSNAGDVNFEALDENARRLHAYAQTFDLKLVELPMPKTWYVDGNTMAASYCNFYIANDLVLVPTFQQKADVDALSILKELFPERDVVGLDARDVVEGMGAFHCATQQQPA